VPWADAEKIVLGAYGAFSPKMATIAERFFQHHWIDAPVRPGKAPGAFAHPTVPSAHPYVLLNYLGRTRDVMTLAHELGHGVHQVLAGPQGVLMASTPLTLAETASVFGEMLTFQALLRQTTDAKKRKALLASKVEDMITAAADRLTLSMQGTRRGKTANLPDRINAIWLRCRESLGDAIMLGQVDLRPISRTSSIRPYVYACAFGDCPRIAPCPLPRECRGLSGKYFAMLKAAVRSTTELPSPSVSTPATTAEECRYFRGSTS
jgi:oligoendopeptidase F